MSDLLRLPAADRAHIDSKKLRDYLLSDEHPQGRYKAAFFGMIGYTRQDWQRLKIDLLQIAQGGVAFPGKISDFGQKYQVNGMLRGPSGRPAWVTTVWIVKNSDDFPTLVTVFPGENP